MRDLHASAVTHNLLLTRPIPTRVSSRYPLCFSTCCLDYVNEEKCEKRGGPRGEAVWDRPGQRRVRRGRRADCVVFRFLFFFSDVRAGPRRSGTSHRKQSDSDSIEVYRPARKPSESDAVAFLKVLLLQNHK